MGVIIDPDLHGNVPYSGRQNGDYRKMCPKCGDWIWPITTIPNMGTLYYIHTCCQSCEVLI